MFGHFYDETHSNSVTSVPLLVGCPCVSINAGWEFHFEKSLRRLVGTTAWPFKKYKPRKEVCDERGSVKMKVDTITKFENCTLLRGDTIVKDDLWVRGGSS